MRRLLAALALIVTLVPRAAPALPAGSGASDPSIVVGVIATLSGPGALAGQDMADGFQLALRQLGGRFANQEVRVVLADDKGSPDTALQQVRRMVERERLDIVLTAVSPASLAAVLPVLTEARLFVLNLDAPPPGMAGPGCQSNFFDLAAPAEGLHEALGLHLAAQQARRVVVVGLDTAITASAIEAFKRAFPGEIAATISPRPGAAVFDAEIKRIKELRPDAVYSLLTSGMGVGFMRAYDAAGLRAEVPLYSTWMALERPLLPALGDAAIDLVSIGTWSPDLDSIPNKRFSTDFENEHGRPATTWAAQGYDAAFLIDAALKLTNGKTGDHDAVRAGFRRAEFVSVRGGFKFNTNHFPILSYYLRKVSRDARGRLTQEIQAAVLKDWRDRAAVHCPMRWVEEPPASMAPKKP